MFWCKLFGHKFVSLPYSSRPFILYCKRCGKLIMKLKFPAVITGREEKVMVVDDFQHLEEGEG